MACSRRSVFGLMSILWISSLGCDEHVYTRADPESAQAGRKGSGTGGQATGGTRATGGASGTGGLQGTSAPTQTGGARATGGSLAGDLRSATGGATGGGSSPCAETTLGRVDDRGVTLEGEKGGAACTPEERATYETCLRQACGAGTTLCFDLGARGEVGGACGTYYRCLEACPCGNESCQAACDGRQCLACVAAQADCAAGCAVPTCLSFGLR